MFKKSFFNPFSAMVLALAVFAFFIDVVMQAKGDASIFAPVVLFLMWLVGGIVRLFYEKEAKLTFGRHMAEARHALVWKRSGELWAQIDASLLPLRVKAVFHGGAQKRSCGREPRLPMVRRRLRSFRFPRPTVDVLLRDATWARNMARVRRASVWPLRGACLWCCRS